MVMDPATVAAISAALQAGASYFGGKKGEAANKRSQKSAVRFQERKNRLIDELLAGVSGSGQYSNLFRDDDAAFQSSFVDPAKKMFSNQIAPQIQQQYIAGGMQRGTGMEDTLTRAGVDLDSMLNSAFMNFKQQGQQKKLGALSGILGQSAPQVFGQTDPMAAMLGGLGGYFGSENFGKTLQGSLNQDQSQGNSGGTGSFQGSEEDRMMLNPQYNKSTLFSKRAGY